MLPPVMANITPADASVAVWVLIGISALAFAFNQLMEARKRLGEAGNSTISVRPDPHTQFRARPDCTAIHEKDREWIRRVEAASVGYRDDARKDLRVETDKVHQRIDSLHTSMNSQLNAVAKQLGRISGRLGIGDHEL